MADGDFGDTDDTFTAYPPRMRDDGVKIRSDVPPIPVPLPTTVPFDDDDEGDDCDCCFVAVVAMTLQWYADNYEVAASPTAASAPDLHYYTVATHCSSTSNTYKLNKL